MTETITVSAREFGRHNRRYRKLLDAGHTLIVTQGRHRYSVRASEQVEVPTDLLHHVHALLNPSGELSDDEVVRRALVLDLSTQQMAHARASATRDDDSSRTIHERLDRR